MSTKKKAVIIISIIVLLLGAFIAIKIITSKVTLSAPKTLGNTAGNLYNGGLFCERDGSMFFSNYNDFGTLYSYNFETKKYKKLYDDNASFINADENYVYYSRYNNKKPKEVQSVFKVFSNGLYRLTHSGKYLKQIYGQPTGSVLVYDNNIYYQHYDKKTGLFIYKTDINGENELSLLDEDILPLCVYNDKIYYTKEESDHFIHTLSLDNFQDLTINTDFSYMPIVTNDYIYFISTLEGHGIYRITHDNSRKELVVDSFCSSYNISPDGRFLFYQVDSSDSNRLCQIDLQSGEIETIMPGDFGNIHVINNTIYFSTFDGTTYYSYDYNGNKEVTLFNPPKLD